MITMRWGSRNQPRTDGSNMIDLKKQMFFSQEKSVGVVDLWISIPIGSMYGIYIYMLTFGVY